MKKDFMTKLANQLSEVFPAHLNSLKADFEKNCQHILNKAFSKLDLVTREEFDVQTKVLLRTRKKLEALEKTLTELETLLKRNAGKNK